MLVGDGTGLVELGRVEGDGLLAEHVLAGGQSGTQIGDMRVVRRCDIDGVDVRIGVEVLNSVIDLLDAILLCKSLSLGQRAVGDTRKLAAGKGERLGHLVGDNAATDHSPAKLRSRKNVIGERLILDRGKRCFCGCRRVEWNLLGICHMCLLRREMSFFLTALYLHKYACMGVFLRISPSNGQHFYATNAYIRISEQLNAKERALIRTKTINGEQRIIYATHLCLSPMSIFDLKTVPIG